MDKLSRRFSFERTPRGFTVRHVSAGMALTVEADGPLFLIKQSSRGFLGSFYLPQDAFEVFAAECFRLSVKPWNTNTRSVAATHPTASPAAPVTPTASGASAAGETSQLGVLARPSATSSGTQ